MQKGKKEVKMSLLTDGMMAYVEDPKKCTKLLEPVGEFGEFTGLKVIITKLILFLHTSTEQLKAVTKHHLQQHQKYEILRDKYNKIVPREIKADLNTWGAIPR